MTVESGRVESVTLRDVFQEGLAALRADWTLHLAWNAIWVAVAMVSCCGFTIVLGVISAVLGITSGGGGPERLTSMGAMIAVVYAVLIPAMLGLYALHQTVTMTLVHGRARGTPVSLRDAVTWGLRRTPALVGHMLLRFFVEGTAIVGIYLSALAVVWLTAEDTPSLDHLSSLGPLAWIVIGIAYVAVIVVGFGFRVFLGLAFPMIVQGGTALAAFGGSTALLRGRRWQFLRFRLVVLATWIGSYSVCVAPWLLTAIGSEGRPNPIVAIVTLVLVLGFYGVALLLFVLDAGLEAAFHERLTRPMNAAQVARTFE